MLAHTCNPSTWDAEAGRLRVQGLHYIATPCLKKRKKRAGFGQKQLFPETAEVSSRLLRLTGLIG
jgi:hypothetical protein